MAECQIINGEKFAQPCQEYYKLLRSVVTKEEQMYIPQEQLIRLKIGDRILCFSVIDLFYHIMDGYNKLDTPIGDCFFSKGQIQKINQKLRQLNYPQITNEIIEKSVQAKGLTGESLSQFALEELPLPMLQQLLITNAKSQYVSKKKQELIFEQQQHYQEQARKETCVLTFSGAQFIIFAERLIPHVKLKPNWLNILKSYKPVFKNESLEDKPLVSGCNYLNILFPITGKVIKQYQGDNYPLRLPYTIQLKDQTLDWPDFTDILNNYYNSELTQSDIEYLKSINSDNYVLNLFNNNSNIFKFNHLHELLGLPKIELLKNIGVQRSLPIILPVFDAVIKEYGYGFPISLGVMIKFE